MHKLIIVSFLVILLVSSCGTEQATKQMRSSGIVFPPPPSAPRIQFLTKITTEKDLAGTQGTSALDRILGEEKVSAINRPYGLLVNRDTIFVCDTRINCIVVIDLKEQTMDYFQPMGRGEMRTPLNLCADASGKVYVADSERREVLVFAPGLKYLTSISEGGDSKPVDVEFWNNEIFVLDMAQQQIRVYDPETLQKKRVLTQNYISDEDGKLYSPVNLTIGNGRFYVSDIGDPSVKVFDNNGNLLDVIGSLGNQLGQFTRPKGIALDADQNLYVVDGSFENVQIFNREGELLLPFGGPYEKPGDMYLPAGVFIDYDHLEHFQKYVDPEFTLKYLIFVSNMYGPDMINVYGFIGPTGSDQGTDTMTEPELEIEPEPDPKPEQEPEPEPE